MREIAPFFNPGQTTAWYLPLSMMCLPVGSPAGQAIYARAATVQGGVCAYEVILLGWLGGLPAFDTIPLAAIAGPGRWYPANASIATIDTNTGTGWTYGAGFTVVNPAPNDLLVAGMEARADTTHVLDPGTMWQVGYGPAGSETWCATLTMGRTWCERWVWPPVLVKAGERLAVRSAYSAVVSRRCRVKVYDL
jgi:hypothetical protein